MPEERMTYTSDEAERVRQRAWSSGKREGLEAAKSIYRTLHPGGCKMFSRGEACKCFLCQIEEAHAAEGMTDEMLLRNLVALVRRLAHRLKKHEPNNDLPQRVDEFLRRHDLNGSILRGEHCER